MSEGTNFWKVTIRPNTFDSIPILKADSVLMTEIVKLDLIAREDILKIDGISIPDPRWRIAIRSGETTSVWDVTITA